MSTSHLERGARLLTKANELHAGADDLHVFAGELRQEAVRLEELSAQELRWHNDEIREGADGEG